MRIGLGENEGLCMSKKGGVYIIQNFWNYLPTIYCDSSEYFFVIALFPSKTWPSRQLKSRERVLWSNFIRTLGKMGIGGIGFHFVRVM